MTMTYDDVLKAIKAIPADLDIVKGAAKAFYTEGASDAPRDTHTQIIKILEDNKVELSEAIMLLLAMAATFAGASAKPGKDDEVLKDMVEFMTERFRVAHAVTPLALDLFNRLEERG